MSPEEVRSLIKSLRRETLYTATPTAKTVSLGRDEICRMIPHREPLLLVDAIDGFDADRRTIRGRRQIAEDDPIFAGHFPAEPVYPGVLQVEAIGQLALCLAGLIGQQDAGVRVRATRIHHAIFLAPVGPRDELTLCASIIADDGLTAVSAGQIFRAGELCSCAVQEVCYVD